MSGTNWPNRSSSRRRALTRHPSESVIPPTFAPPLSDSDFDDTDFDDTAAPSPSELDGSFDEAAKAGLPTLDELAEETIPLVTETAPETVPKTVAETNTRFINDSLAADDDFNAGPTDDYADVDTSSGDNRDADKDRPASTRHRPARRVRPAETFANRLTESRKLATVERMLTSEYRVRKVVIGLLLFWGVLAARLVQLQYFDGADYAEQARRQHSQSVDIPARSGDIVDRRGRLLTTTVACQSLYVVPRRISDPAKLAQRLSEALSLSEQEVLRTIIQHRQKHFLWIKRQLTAEQVDQIEKLQLEPETFGFREEYRREYPQGRLAAHVLGLRDIDGVGRGGLEQAFDAILGGKSGALWHRRDAHGRVIDVQARPAVAPVHGRTVVTTLDSVIQLYAEQELDRAMQQWKPRSACAIVMAVKTGEILAMSSRPAFDPRHPAADNESAWNNTCLASVYEPGSTFKPLIVADAMQAGLLSLDESFDCEDGEYRMGKRLLHDHHPYGELDVTDILVKSSNIGMAKIGERMGNQRLFDATVAFGFGRKTGINLPGELPGILRPLKEWNGYSTGSIPMGQELAATPLQVITAHAALANGGRWQTPRLLHGALDPATGELVAEPADLPRHGLSMQIVAPDVASSVVQGPMVAVVKRGTGRKAQLPGYTVFGKSGTSQKTDPKTGMYSNRLHVSSFICGAPAGNPEVLVLFVIDEATNKGDHYGGRLAAPAAAAILQKTLVYLRIPTNSDAPLAEPAADDLAESYRDDLL